MLPLAANRSSINRDAVVSSFSDFSQLSYSVSNVPHHCPLSAFIVVEILVSMNIKNTVAASQNSVLRVPRKSE
jgi:hypothetical protein